MELTTQDFHNLRDEIRNICGLHIVDEKRYLVEQRLGPIAEAEGCLSFADFYEKLAAKNDRQLRELVIAAITTNETSFFRDTHLFQAFSESILPFLEKRTKERKEHTRQRRGPKVSILCAGASTGQEPFSLSILIHEYAEQSRFRGVVAEDFAITAIDISSEALATAMEGKYSDMELSRGLSPELISKYFTETGARWQVNKNVHSLVTFRKINLIDSFSSLGSFDVIFCRNVLIYFEDHTRHKILGQFHDMLTENGYLMLGASENLYNQPHLFRIDRRNNTILYQPAKEE